MSEFGQFLKTVGSRWVNLFTGGALIAAVSGWDHLGPVPIPRWGWWLVTALTFTSACFLAWREQYRLRQVAGPAPIQPPLRPAVVVSVLPNVDVMTTPAGVRVVAYLSVANVSADTLSIDLTGVSIGNGLSGLAAHHLALKPYAVERLAVSGDSTAEGGADLKKAGETTINGWLSMHGLERQGFTIHRVPVRDAGTLR